MFHTNPECKDAKSCVDIGYHTDWRAMKCEFKTCQCTSGYATRGSGIDRICVEEVTADYSSIVYPLVSSAKIWKQLKCLLMLSRILFSLWNGANWLSI